MKQLWTRIRTPLKGAATAFMEDHTRSMGAALADYTMFSIAPLLFLVIMLAGLVFGEEAARGEIFAQLRGLMGDQGASAIQAMVQSVREPATGAPSLRPAAPGGDRCSAGLRRRLPADGDPRAPSNEAAK